MGRPPASGLRYLPWDVGVLENSIEIDKLVGAQGSGGFLVYFAICQRAASKTGYYYAWDEDEPPVWARKLGGGVTRQCVEQTVKFCLRIGLFDKGLFDREGILTSRRLQRNFVTGIRGRRREAAVVAEYWMLEGEKPPGIVFYTKNEFFHTANPDLQYLKPSFDVQNEMKRNEIKTPPNPPQKVDRKERCRMLLAFWQSRTGVNLQADNQARRAVYQRMDAGATNEEMEQVITMQCAAARRGEWRGVGSFPLPQELFGEKWSLYKMELRKGQDHD